MPIIKSLALGLLLVFVAQSAALADETKAKAIADFTNSTLPNILLMAPYISKSADERRLAYAELETRTYSCMDAFSSAYSAKEDMAVDTAKVCLALRYWMQNADSMTCLDLKAPSDRDLFPSRADGKIKRGFKAAQVQTVYDDLQTAAGCKTKDTAFWTQHAIDDYTAMAKLLYGVDKANLNTILPNIKVLNDSCFGSDTLGAAYSKVSDSAHWGCIAIGLYARNDGSDSCFAWYTARNNAKSVPESDPYYDQLLALRVSFHSLSGQTGCETKVQEHFAQHAAAEAQAAEDARTQSEFDGFMNTYINERKQADEYMKLVDAWEDRATQYLANGVGRSESLDSSVCRYYQYAREHVYNAQVAAYNMYRLRPTDANRSRAETEKRNREFLDAKVNAWCK